MICEYRQKVELNERMFCFVRNLTCKDTVIDSYLLFLCLHVCLKSVLGTLDTAIDMCI